ncbi:MAG TPA: hypothetical protein VLA91_08725 [Acidimicrobiia bacterium]|nr:hypothetical protein [Acidimicrobiia bacterium]
MGRLLWPAVVTAVAVVAVVVSGAGADTRAELDYLDTMHDTASELSIGGETLRVVISRLARIERSELVTATDGIRASLDAGLELAEAGPPSDTLVATNALYRQAIEAWTVGVSGFTSGILAAADDPSSTVVVDNIANALAELRAGDRIYADLVRELGREEVPDPVAPMPELVMVPAAGELLTLSLAYVEASRSPNSGIALRPGLRVASITSEPRWNVNPSQQAVVPSTELVDFWVVITNSGNVASDPERIDLTVGGASEPVALTETVPVLEPGEQTSIQFLEIPVVPGGIYEVVASLTELTNDTNFEDNTVSVMFEVSEGG